MTIGQSIRKIRRAKGYALDVLGVKSGVSLGALSRWERDESDPRVTMLWYIADILEVSLDELVGREIKFSNAEWIKNEKGEVVCSKCSARPLFMMIGNIPKRVRTPYCPRCGTKMEEIKHE